MATSARDRSRSRSRGHCLDDEYEESRASSTNESRTSGINCDDDVVDGVESVDERKQIRNKTQPQDTASMENAQEVNNFVVAVFPPETNVFDPTNFYVNCLHGICADWMTGLVASVVADTQAEHQGVRAGMQIATIDGAPYSFAVLDSRLRNRRPLTVAFRSEDVVDTLLFDVKVIGGASGNELCLLKALPTWTVGMMQTAIKEMTDIPVLAQNLSIHDKVLSSKQMLVDLVYEGQELVVSLVRSSVPSTTSLHAWLMSLDDGGGAMLNYFDVLNVEFDGDLDQIAAAKVHNPGQMFTNMGWISSVDPSFWEVVGVQQVGHKMLFARGIAYL